MTDANFEVSPEIKQIDKKFFVTLPCDCFSSMTEMIKHFIKYIYTKKSDSDILNFKLYWTPDGILILDTEASGYFFHYDLATYEFTVDNGLLKIFKVGDILLSKDFDRSLYEVVASLILRATIPDTDIPKIPRLKSIAETRLAEVEGHKKEGAVVNITTPLLNQFLNDDPTANDI